MKAVDEKEEYLGSSVIHGKTYNYFRGSDLYVYQFHGDKKIGYLCHISGWEAFISKMNIELAPICKCPMECQCGHHAQESGK